MLYDRNNRLTLNEQYFGNLVLNFGVPVRILHADGVIELDSRMQPTYYYHLKDHLGNVRAVVSPGSNNTTVVNQTNEYYPFGMSYSKNAGSLLNPAVPNKYKYNGKEEQEMPGKWLDYGARFYDTQLGRWHSVDPIAEVARRWSPYQYAYNNPVRYTDPDGRSPLIPLLLWKATGYLMEKFGSSANVKTAGYGMNHPINGVRTGTVDKPTWGISKVASNFEVNLRNEAGFTKGEGSQGNAYRHTLWQSILTNEFGADQATRIGNVHEDNLPTNMNQREFGKNMGLADQMADLLNNGIGREIGEKNKGASNQELSVGVLNEYKQNGLWTVSGDKKTGFKVEKTQLSQKDYNNALEVLKTKGENGLNH